MRDDPEPKKKSFKKSTALLMYEWAKNKPEYEEEKERYRRLNSNYSEATIEKMAFFKFSAKVCGKNLFKKIKKRNSRH